MNLFELFVKIGADTGDLDKGLDESESRVSKFASSLGSGLGKAAKVVGEVSVAATTAAVAGVTAMTTAAVNSYGEYEQLTGGIKKLYGEAYDDMMAHASEAYATAGMDANTYMQSVTTFSAGLISALDGDVNAAAEIADMAMQDLADNANTFGTMTAQELTSVYTNLAKGNYTLLDNLNLGFAGTQEGMIDLINASGILEEQIDSLDNVSLDQMYLAIHEVQTQFNITGTTANEAAGTIQGSLGSMQAAWRNLITGLGDGSADLGKLIDNVVKSATNLVKNIRPIATQAISGISTLVTELAPVIAEELPELIREILPELTTAVTGLIDAVVEVLPDLLSVLLPLVLESVMTIVGSLGEVLTEAVPILADAAMQIVLAIMEALETTMQGDGLTAVLDVAMQIITSFANFLIENVGTLMATASEIIVQLIHYFTEPSNLNKLVSMSLDLMVAIAGGLVDAIPELVGVIPEVVGALIGAIIMNFPQILETIGELIGALGAAILLSLLEILGVDLDTVTEGLSVIGDAISSAFDSFVGFFNDLGSNLAGIVSSLWSNLAGLFTGGLDGISSGVSTGLDAIKGFFTGIFDDIEDLVGDAVDWLKGAFDFEWHLPEIELPHISVSGGKAPYGIAGRGSLPSFSIEWYAKAYKDPYILTKPTIFGFNNSGDLLGGGEGGDEVIYGRQALMDDMATVVAKVVGANSNQQIIIPVYIGNEMIDELVVNSNQRNDFISGGR